jgi:crotonobetainyl-CoA:carnitine CoA-transferase CaiB-like acyl-CoA transferase
MATAERPLSSYLVVEVANYIAAPAAGAILAELGARVIHVEPTGGDPYRGFRLGLSGFGATQGGEEVAFHVDNRGKESLAVDLRTPQGREILGRLLERADVLITNLAEAQLEAMGLDAGRVAAAYPRLVYARVSGYGVRGPDRHAESFDLGAFWARGGILQGLAYGEELAQPRPGVGDHATAISLVAGIVLSLLVRERTGTAPPARTSLLETALWMNALDIAGAAFYGRAPEQRQGGSLPLISAYQTADGRRLYLQVTHDAGWRALCAAVEHPEWLEDERFKGLGLRRKHAAPLRELLREVLGEKPLEEWQEIFRSFGVPTAIVNTALDIVSDEQVLASGHLRIDEVEGGRLATVGAPFELGEAGEEGQGRRAPGHGEHTELILLDLGYDWEQVAALRTAGVIGPG